MVSQDEGQAAVAGLAPMLAGKLIALDGPDGSGKSSQLQRLLEDLKAVGADVLYVREPGGTPIGEAVRSLVLSPDFSEMELETELFLFMASRSQLVRQEIIPALEAGKIVLTDRFLASTYAYQGITDELRTELGIEGIDIERIAQVAEIALGPLPPMTTLIFDIDAKTAQERLLGTKRSTKRAPAATHKHQLSLFADRMEGMAERFQEKVRRMYRHLPQWRPDGFRAIDGTGDADAVFGRLIDALTALHGETK